MNFLDPKLPIRFWEKCVIDPAGCWLWTAATNKDGYGVCRFGKQMRLAHRIAYMALMGGVPERLELDHLCRVRHCCNPAHLEAVTHSENIIRGLAPTRAGLASTARAALRTHCRHGHEFSDENTYYWKNAKICRTCVREKQRAYLIRRAA